MSAPWTFTARRSPLSIPRRCRSRWPEAHRFRSTWPMGPRALAVTGELADGTLPASTGPRTLEGFIVPTIQAAAAKARRPRPRIIAMVSVAVTDDVDTARAAAAESLALYDSIASYQKVLAREG